MRRSFVVSTRSSYVPTLLFYLLTFLNSLAAAQTSKRCEPITIPLCMGIGYNLTAYPNSYGHEKQEEAGLEVHQFFPLVEYGCYKHLKFFLCSMYTPICQPNYDKQILPCKELCEQAQHFCSPIMQKYGFRWPETLSCESLPSRDEQADTGQICAAPPDTPSTKSPKKQHKQPYPPRKTASDELDPQVGIYSECSCRCTSPYISSSSPTAKVGNVSHCALPCHSPHVTEGHKAFLESWMSIWSIACIAASSFTLLTFFIEPDRFQYPERLIFVLAFCQLMIATGVAIRVGVGHDAVACESKTLRVPQESDGSTCLLIFLLTYYFGMAACVWWVLLSLTWVLAAGSKWSSEAIASYYVHFHVVGWLLPAFQTALVILFHAIDIDNVSGLCFVGHTNVQHLTVFVLAPLVVYFAVGVIFLFIGFFNLWRIRLEVRRQHLQSSLTALISKIGVFSVLYTLPALFYVLILFYEQEHRPQWEAAVLCPCASGVSAAGQLTPFWLSLLRTSCQLVVGLSTGIWILSTKTLASWRARLCCLPIPGRASSTAKYRPAEMIYVKSDCSVPPHFYTTTMRGNGGGQHHNYLLGEKL